MKSCAGCVQLWLRQVRNGEVIRVRCRVHGVVANVACPEFKGRPVAKKRKLRRLPELVE